MHLTTTDSTNNHLKRLLAKQDDLPEFFTLSTDYQSAGRGQAGNGWESENARNLLFTTLFRLHDISAASQFLLSEMVSLAIVNALYSFAEKYTTTPCRFTIKWPNDIYYEDSKLAGVLIEHCLLGGRLEWSIAGIGINVNQMEFKSNAPNPVSMRQILKANNDIDRFSLLEGIIQQFHELRPLFRQPEELKRLYMKNLYRFDNFYLYKEAVVSSSPMMPSADTTDAFYAKICDILPDGRLVLQLKDGTQRTYHFKEVRYCIPYAK